MGDVRVLSWDWKEQPEIEDVERILQELGANVHVQHVDTDSDQFAWAFSTEPITVDEATHAYHQTVYAKDDPFWGAP